MKKGSRNTMTLKDFHGGSIPTDLLLPSIPGGSIPTERKRERCLLLELEEGYLGHFPECHLRKSHMGGM